MANVVFTSGSGTWTVPGGYKLQSIQLLGGGAGGFYHYGGNGTAHSGGGGGGFVKHNINALSGTVISYSVGAGGGPAVNGGSTTCSTYSLSSGTAIGGAGGYPSGGNSLNYNGGNGVGAGPGFHRPGGSGGGASGPNGVGSGSTGDNGLGGAPGANSGVGGNGTEWDGTYGSGGGGGGGLDYGDGGNGGAYGAGGGGRGSNGVTDGSGTNGMIMFTYVAATSTGAMFLVF